MELVKIDRARGTPRRRHPDWVKVKLPAGENYVRLKTAFRRLKLHTVCEDAVCPNLGDCWGRGVATFMILGDICTRGCTYCAVSKGKPDALDADEPRRVAEAVRGMVLRHVVITSVDRDDLPDGGASIFAETVHEVRKMKPDCTIEVLIPDFRGQVAPLQTVLDSRPDILNHNTETVPRLFKPVRCGGRYHWSMDLLDHSKRLAPDILTKSGLMLGLGEERPEILEVLQDLRLRKVDILTLGQYLRPGRQHAPVARYYPPEEFAELGRLAENMGFLMVESAPLVRSSFHADEQARQAISVACS
jgi:lipoic acid synthetase